MNTITVTENNRQDLGKGRVAFGRQQMGCRGGSYETYQVRLSGMAAKLVENGDQIHWWDCGSDLPTIWQGGEIVKPDGKRIHLHGSRDVGIDTGHPPRMRATRKTIKGVAWEWDSRGGISYSVTRAPWGTWYKFTYCPPGKWGVKSHEEFMNWASNVEVFNGETQVISKNRRLFLITDSEDQEGWISGSLIPQKKVIGDITIGEPLIT